MARVRHRSIGVPAGGDDGVACQHRGPVRPCTVPGYGGRLPSIVAVDRPHKRRPRDAHREHGHAVAGRPEARDRGNRRYQVGGGVSTASRRRWSTGRRPMPGSHRVEALSGVYATVSHSAPTRTTDPSATTAPAPTLSGELEWRLGDRSVVPVAGFQSAAPRRARGQLVPVVGAPRPAVHEHPVTGPRNHRPVLAHPQGTTPLRRAPEHDDQRRKLPAEACMLIRPRSTVDGTVSSL